MPMEDWEDALSSFVCSLVYQLLQVILDEVPSDL